ncbi:IclR family transcriptional regulator [Candidimonas nitroreducens]|nr:IclR family transcriptional regulator C-terminal domain-containing protein [Candidimonas nitroreducens]
MQTEDDKRYHLGPLSFYLGLMGSEQGDLRDTAASLLTAIADETGDTVFLMVRVGVEAICADRRAGHYPIKTFVVDVGTRRPLGIGAGGMAILSTLSDTEMDAAMDANTDRIARFPGFTDESIRKTVAVTRRHGYSMMDVPVVTGVRAIGYPICLSGGPAIAAFSIAAIAPRITSQRSSFLVKVLQSASTELVKRLAPTHQGSRIPL